MVKDFKELIVWQKSIKIVEDIYKLTKRFPDEEMFGLVSQLRRAGVSIPSNIAEGFRRNNRNEFRQFLRVASGSAAEAETQIVIARNIGYITREESADVIDELEEVSKMITSILRKLK